MAFVFQTELPVSLTLRLFGGFEVQVSGCPLSPLRTRKGQWLLALLALRANREVSRDWLTEMLWPDSTESLARANLRNALYNLRQTLGVEARRLLAPTPHTLRFDLSDACCDLLAFDAAIAQGEAASLEEAVRLYRGSLLEGCREEWVFSERQIREQAYLMALETLAAYAADGRDYETAANYLRRVLTADPFRESAICRLMEAQAARGDYAEVTRTYRDFRLSLYREMNLTPAAETTAFYQKLRSAQEIRRPHLETRPSLSPSPSSPSTAPARPLFPVPLNPLTRLIGREKELEEICACLQTSRLVTLKGPGGSGKTRLAIALGKRLWESFAEQVWFVSLAELPDPARLPQTLCEALHLPPDQPNPFVRIVSHLSLQPVLLILDNYEHLIEQGARFVQELLEAIPALVCLVTSRQPLHLAGETEYRVQPLALPDKEESIARLLDFPGVQLFVERAAARRAGFQLTPDNSEAVVALCAKLEGIPLAIELVAAWSDMLTPSQMRARLEARFDFPGGRHSEMPERHRSLQQAFDASYALLDDSEQRLLRRLSVFTGGWTLEAAEAICSEEGRSAAVRCSAGSWEKTEQATASSQHTLILLKQLVEKSLVLFQEDFQKGTGQSRYHLLEMTRQYAREQFSEEEREEAERRHADYFLTEALAGELEHFEKGNSCTLARKMRPDKENYDAALRRWQARDAEKALAMLLALDTCRVWLPQMQERRDLVKQLEGQLLPTPTPLQSKFYLHAGEWADFWDRPLGIALAEQAYLLAERCEDNVGMAGALFWLGEWDLRLEKIERARERLEASRDYATRAGYLIGIARAQNLLISVACAENDFGRAQQMGDELLRAGRDKNHWSTMYQALEALGRLAVKQQEYSRACDYLEQAIAIIPEAEGIPRSNTLRLLSRTVSRLEDHETARDYLYQSLAICQTAGFLPHEAWTYHGLANVAHWQGNNTEAIAWSQKALRLFDRLGEIWCVISCFENLARFSESQPERSAFFWSAYARVAQESGDLFASQRREEIEIATAPLRAALTESVFSAIRKKVAAMNIREVVAYALKE